jgi:hypothetical protein
MFFIYPALCRRKAIKLHSDAAFAAISARAVADSWMCGREEATAARWRRTQLALRYRTAPHC